MSCANEKRILKLQGSSRESSQESILKRKESLECNRFKNLEQEQSDQFLSRSNWRDRWKGKHLPSIDDGGIHHGSFLLQPITIVTPHFDASQLQQKHQLMKLSLNSSRALPLPLQRNRPFSPPSFFLSFIFLYLLIIPSSCYQLAGWLKPSHQSGDGCIPSPPPISKNKWCIKHFFPFFFFFFLFFVQFDLFHWRSCDSSPKKRKKYL